MKRSHNQSGDLSIIHKFPNKSPVGSRVKAIMDMDCSQVRPFPKGHLEFPIPDNVKWYYSKLDGTFLQGQFEKPSMRIETSSVRVKPIKFHHLLIGRYTTSIWYQHWWLFKCEACGTKFLGRRDRYVGSNLKSCGCLSQQGKKMLPNERDRMWNYANNHIIRKAQKNEIVEMFTGNVHKREGLVKVTIDDAYRIWDGTATLEEIAEKKKRMGDSYFDNTRIDESLQTREINRREKQFMMKHGLRRVA